MSGVDFQPQRGAIALFDLNPTKGSQTSKIRPCIVVTNDVYNSRLKVIQVVPVTDWSAKKSRIVTNITLIPNKDNGLSKKSIADCLQTRPVDYTKRFIKYRGQLNLGTLQQIDRALAIVFGLT
ncbi:MAG: type II toxin-antitoxin system PemK/MazF family toxin [Cyanobacteria bacterium P01_A01_bin.83]